ncbi:Calx-beta domain-containing protein, partial [Arenibacter nanhaiticus]
MKLRSPNIIFANPTISQVLKRFASLLVLMLLAFSGYGQDPISISDVTLVEGNSGTTAFEFTVSVDGGGNATNEITFNYATADNTATLANGDYQSSMGIGTIPLGSPNTTVTVQVNGDFFVEPNEDFFVNLSLPINATITDGQG